MLSRSSGYKRAFLRRTVLETRKDMMSEQVSVSKSNIRGAFGAFFIPGMYTALWAGFVPYLKAKLSIGEDVLGSMILLLGVGSCLSMAIAGKLVESFGCKRVVLLASFIGMVSLAIVTMCPTIATTTVALFFFGIGVGLSGASANLQAILTEKVSKKHLMGAYHGGWSLGGFAGAGVLLVLLKILSLPVNQSIWGLLIVLFIAMVVVSQFMLTFGSDPNAKVTKKSKSPLSFHPIALIFGLLSFVSYLVEGAVGDWSALYLFEDKGIVIEEAVMGVMLFNGTMCIGRLLGNRLGKHLTSKQVVVGGYLLIIGYFISYDSTKPILCNGGTKCHSYDTSGRNIHNARLYGYFDGTCLNWFHCARYKSYSSIYRIDYIACCKCRYW